MKKKEIEKQYQLMTEKKVEPLILQLAAPTILSMLVSNIYNLADTFFVGQIDTKATAAVGVVFSLMALIQATGFLFGHGSGNYIARKLGAGEKKAAEEMASFGVFFAIVASLIIMALGFLFLEPLAKALGATPTIIEETCEYMKIILLGTPFILASFTLNSQLRFEGKAMYAMIGIVSGAMLNIILDPIFIFGLGMGIRGAALATVISQMVGFSLLFFGMNKWGIPFAFRHVKCTKENWKNLIKGGFPSLARQGCGSMATMVMNHIAGGYGDAAIAAISVVSRISMFAGSALIGFGQGFQPFCGFNYGAKKYDRVKRGFWFCIKTSFLVLLALSFIAFGFAEPLMKLFRNDDAEVIRIGAMALRFQSISFPFIGVTVLANMLTQTIGKSKQATLLAISRQFLFLVPALLILTSVLGIKGLQMSQMVADFGALALAIPVTIKVFKEMKEN